MSYAAPSVGPTGLVINGYQDILDFYLDGATAIFGSAQYFGNDSWLYQLMANVAITAADANSALQLAYNQQSPVTAVGAGLSTIVAVNGLQRLSASYSTCQVVLSGTAGTVITDGEVSDINGNIWNLPPSVTIGSGGTVTVTATAQQTGAINITAPNQIVNIYSGQTAGWTGVNNNSYTATLGEPNETDSQLRVRQAQSTELPSETLGAGTIAAILAVPGVVRVNNNPTLGVDGTTSFENWTGSTDDWGNPGHSISPVVQGGDPVAVATAIYNNRGLGVLTNGSTGGTLVTEDITDPNSGIVTEINFATPQEMNVFVTLTAHVLNGGSETVLAPLIKAAIVAYIESLPIGAIVSYGELVAAANSVNTIPLTYSVRTLEFCASATTCTPSASTDIALEFYQVPVSATGDIVVTWV
jgi:Baseplate J-like protein